MLNRQLDWDILSALHLTFYILFLSQDFFLFFHRNRYFKFFYQFIITMFAKIKFMAFQIFA